MKLLNIKSVININDDHFRLIPRTQEMTQLLLSRGIMSKEKLLETWKEDESC